MHLKKVKCDFCRFWSGRSCTVTPNSYYCKEAINEYYQYLQSDKINQPIRKSLRAWDKK